MKPGAFPWLWNTYRCATCRTQQVSGSPEQIFTAERWFCSSSCYSAWLDSSKPMREAEE